MTVLELMEINTALEKESIKVEALTEVVEMLNRLLAEHFLVENAPPTLDRTGRFLEDTLLGLKDMLQASQRRSASLISQALPAHTNGAPHA